MWWILLVRLLVVGFFLVGVAGQGLEESIGGLGSFLCSNQPLECFWFWGCEEKYDNSAVFDSCLPSSNMIRSHTLFRANGWVSYSDWTRLDMELSRQRLFSYRAAAIPVETSMILSWCVWAFIFLLRVTYASLKLEVCSWRDDWGLYVRFTRWARRLQMTITNFSPHAFASASRARLKLFWDSFTQGRSSLLTDWYRMLMVRAFFFLYVFVDLLRAIHSGSRISSCPLPMSAFLSQFLQSSQLWQLSFRIQILLE